MRLSDIKLGHSNRDTDSISQSPVQVIAIAGGKGGTGKTNIAVNLAQALANEGKRTLILDADLGMANVDVLLGLTPENTLYDVMRGKCELEDILLTGGHNLMVIPAASGVGQLANMRWQECAGLVRAFSDLKEPVDTLIVDTATGVSESVAVFCQAANEILVVVCNEPASIRDCVSQLKHFYRDYGIARYRVLANMVDSASEANTLFQNLIENFTDDHNLQISYAGYIPTDEHVRKAVHSHQSVVNSFPRSPSAMALKKLASRTMEWPRPKRAGGHVEFFVERLIDNENMGMEVIS
ncbi:MAG: P-loop NTPase [Gammaproteobacteria bacterium]|nr:P-loop NTPase [Gammaproteobacteria bacterium]